MGDLFNYIKDMDSNYSQRILWDIPTGISLSVVCIHDLGTELDAMHQKYVPAPLGSAIPSFD